MTRGDLRALVLALRFPRVKVDGHIVAGTMTWSRFIRMADTRELNIALQQLRALERPKLPRPPRPTEKKKWWE